MKTMKQVNRFRMIGVAGMMMVAAMALSSANAAIILDSSTAGTGTIFQQEPGKATLSGFDATASDKLVVLAGGAGSGGVPNVQSITYNGVAMNLATQGSSTGPDRGVGIFYLDSADFSGAGDIVANFGPGNLYQNGYDIGAFALSGTATGFDAGSSNNGTGSDGTSATITVAQAGSFVVAVNSYGVNTATGMTMLGSDALSRAYQSDVGAGSFTADFGGGNVTSVASFSAIGIPEPTSLALLGLGGLALLSGRRRRRS